MGHIVSLTSSSSTAGTAGVPVGAERPELDAIGAAGPDPALQASVLTHACCPAARPGFARDGDTPIAP